MEEYKLFIDGEFVDSATGEVFQSIDPGTEQPFAKVAKAGPKDAEAAVAAARRAFDTGGMEDRQAALAAADAIEGLMRETGHPMRLRHVGVPEESLPLAAFQAIADSAALFNARPVTDVQEVLNLYQRAY